MDVVIGGAVLAVLLAAPFTFVPAFFCYTASRTEGFTRRESLGFAIELVGQRTSR